MQKAMAELSNNAQKADANRTANDSPCCPGDKNEGIFNPACPLKKIKQI